MNEIELFGTKKPKKKRDCEQVAADWGFIVTFKIRKQVLENQRKLGIQKFSSFSGQSTTAITSVNEPFIVEFKPRSLESNLGDVKRF